MSSIYDNKIVFEEGGIVSHSFIDMHGLEQTSYNLENDVVRNYLHNATYTKADIVNSSGNESTSLTQVRPYFSAKSYRASWGASESAWSESTRPVIIVDTKAGDSIVLASSSHSTSLVGTKGATLVYNLIPKTTYTYTVTRDGETVKTGQFTTEGQCRMIKIQMPNFRDIGGWPCDGGTIAYNKLFRGCGFVGTDTGNYLQLRDAPNKSEVIAALQSLGITHELDLRSPSSSSQPAVNPNYPTGTLSYKNISYLGYGVNSNTVLALKHISDTLSAGGKVWLHCHTAADRAGTLTAIIQMILGCSIDSVVKEWELTMFCGNGYDETYLEHISSTVKFRPFIASVYNHDRSKSLKENIIAMLKTKLPSSVSSSKLDDIISNLCNKLIQTTS